MTYFVPFHHFVFFLNHSVTEDAGSTFIWSKYNCFVSVFSKVSGQVGSSVQKYEKKSIMVMFTSVVVFEDTHWSWLTPPKVLCTEARELEYDVMVRPPPLVFEYFIEASWPINFFLTPTNCCLWIGRDKYRLYAKIELQAEPPYLRLTAAWKKFGNLKSIVSIKYASSENGP